MRSRLRGLSDLTKIVVTSLLVAGALGAGVGSIVYTVSTRASAGCDAAHKVIDSFVVYIQAQEAKITSGTSSAAKYYRDHPDQRRLTLAKDQKGIRVLESIKCS